MVIVDGLNKWFHLRSLILSFFGHAARDLGGIAFYACNKGVRKWMRFRTGVEGLYDDDLIESMFSKALFATPLAVRIAGFGGKIELKYLPFCQHIALV